LVRGRFISKRQEVVMGAFNKGVSKKEEDLARTEKRKRRGGDGTDEFKAQEQVFSNNRKNWPKCAK